jgi:acetylglutamate kinase|tara:strand:+ start:1021 stop:1890 length:870 start_codon:yes stop_codon:yes gene_type:complete
MSEEKTLEEIKKFWPEKAPDINNVLKYVSKYKDEKIVIKCGGNVLIDPVLFKNFIEDIIILNKLSLTTIIVHGGGPRIKNKLSELNIESSFIDGLRVTDKNIINIVENVLIEFNKEIVTALNNKSCKAHSITTKESNVIIVKSERKELGFVGIPQKLELKILEEIIINQKIPVLAPMGLDKDGLPYNINADIAAGAVAKSLNSRRLLLMTNVEGVYDKNKKLIQEITPIEANKMIKEETIISGMIPKINTCIDAVNNGVKGVVIIDGRKPHSILYEIFSDKGAGTLIRK